MSMESKGQVSSTHWSVVLAAGGADTGAARAALATLCLTYTPALYAYLRRKGYREDCAKDLLQEFFAHFLERKIVRSVSKEKGRFRTFLIVCVNNFLANTHDREHARKRGGGWVSVSLEHLAPYEPATDATPETAFERQWAHSLLDGVLAQLAAEHARAGKKSLFDALCPYLTASAAALPYAETAKRLALSEGAVKVAVHRMRKRYRELIRAEVAQTLGDGEDIDAELRYLLSVL